ncbi:uncharacterized protein B0H18DRAFT_995724 [Fomitopsis serialis]|uniref:uncharacterized protein n=1 Tax=Fomitopsis serialis TaxID=139415 RepID=UPI002007482D|nr:uncharacterized protein B0H18DRAFT_995724 [Neoantrodia serialis]KAH9929682.1 hypothetical protein B0H18DRAFT_995724 [Neoantrodia serialis]
MNAHLPAPVMSLYGQDAPMTDNEVIPDLTGPNISLGAPQTISRTSRAAAASARPSSDLAALGLRSATIGNGTSAMAPQDSANVSSARRFLAGFLALMGKKHVTVAPSSSPPAPSNINPLVQLGGDTSASMDSSPLVVPVELLDSDTLCLAESELQPAIMHRYMASVALLQKRVLVRGLLSHQCCIDLIEREDLGDADLILDVDTAVTFASLAALPSQIDAMLARLTRLSWRYSHTLVVFEAYPTRFKKLRRDLSIAEACQTKKAGSAIRLAFATTVEEAASYARYYGDDAEARDTTQGALWGAREWLDFDEQEGEYDLAGVDGMNAFAASIILSQMRLDDFLDTGPEDRVQYFGPYVGHDRLVRFNEELQMRAQAVELTSSSPSSHEASMSI